MKKTKRRDFLKQFFWGSALLYVNPITFSTSGKAITDKANNLPTDEITRKQALTYFYKKEYKNAENLFNKLISVHPDKISYYDGLRKERHVLLILTCSKQNIGYLCSLC